MLPERGIDVSYETIRRWTRKFGPKIARNLRRRQPRPGDVWHLDEVAVKCGGKKYWLWRAVDQSGLVPEEILQKQRDKSAARRLLISLMKRYCTVPKRIITDKLRSYGAAKADVAPGVEHWTHKGLNNRAENSHLPFRKRERTRQRYRSAGALQRFVVMHSTIRNCFSVPSRRRSALTIRGTVAKFAALIKFADIFTSTVTHERIQRSAFQSRHHPVGGTLVLQIRHQLS